MTDLLKNQPVPRKKAVEELQWFLKNPGQFSILLLGERGTGKSFWIDKITKSDMPNKILHTIPCALSEPNPDFWEKAFSKSHGGILVLDEVERLDKRSQELLLVMLSTEKGKYGLTEKKYDVRIVFTSCFDITVLRDTDDYLTHQFFDRISQLVTKLPSFKDSDRGIWNDFKATWKKMDFGKVYKLPDENLSVWLEKNSANFHGNFRDLDKIAINWHQLLLRGGSDEKEILEIIKTDFDKYYHFPEQKTEMHDTFEFKRGKTKDDLEKEWRSKLKQWAKIEYGTLEKAAKILEISPRTFEKW